MSTLNILQAVVIVISLVISDTLLNLFRRVVTETFLPEIEWVLVLREGGEGVSDSFSRPTKESSFSHFRSRRKLKRT